MFGRGGAELHLRWRAVSGGDREAAEEEERLMALTLADDVAHRRVTLAAIAEWGDVGPRGLVVFAGQHEDPRVSVRAWVRVGQQRWWLGEEGFAVGEEGGLRGLLDAILGRLIG